MNNILYYVKIHDQLLVDLLNMQSLKSVTADIGRDILKRHLIMTADCLSATGEFHGLSTKGLRQQRDDMSISSPFTQACLSVRGFSHCLSFWLFFFLILQSPLITLSDICSILRTAL